MQRESRKLEYEFKRNVCIVLAILFVVIGAPGCAAAIIRQRKQRQWSHQMINKTIRLLKKARRLLQLPRRKLNTPVS